MSKIVTKICKNLWSSEWRTPRCHRLAADWLAASCGRRTSWCSACGSRCRCRPTCWAAPRLEDKKKGKPLRKDEKLIVSQLENSRDLRSTLSRSPFCPGRDDARCNPVTEAAEVHFPRLQTRPKATGHAMKSVEKRGKALKTLENAWEDPPFWALLRPFEARGISKAILAPGASRPWEGSTTTPDVLACPLTVTVKGSGTRPKETPLKMTLNHLNDS